MVQKANDNDTAKVLAATSAGEQIPAGFVYDPYGAGGPVHELNQEDHENLIAGGVIVAATSASLQAGDATPTTAAPLSASPPNTADAAQTAPSGATTPKTTLSTPTTGSAAGVGSPSTTGDTTGTKAS